MSEDEERRSWGARGLLDGPFASTLKSVLLRHSIRLSPLNCVARVQMSRRHRVSRLHRVRRRHRQRFHSPSSSRGSVASVSLSSLSTAAASSPPSTVASLQPPTVRIGRKTRTVFSSATSDGSLRLRQKGLAPSCVPIRHKPHCSHTHPSWLVLLPCIHTPCFLNNPDFNNGS